MGLLNFIFMRSNYAVYPANFKRFGILSSVAPLAYFTHAPIVEAGDFWGRG